jgi:hypothetical protein
MSLALACAPIPLGGPPAPLSLGPAETRALVLTRVPAPWWAPDVLVISRFIDSVSEYAAVPLLEHKTYTMSDDRRFGGLYLWPDRPSAERFFDEAWHARVRKSRGVDGDVRVFDARWTVQAEAPVGKPLTDGALRTDALVVWLWAPMNGDADGRLRALAGVHGVPRGLLRVSFVTESTGAGLIATWSSRDAARAFWTQARVSEASAALGANATLTWFSAPVLLDVAAARTKTTASGRTP